MRISSLTIAFVFSVIICCSAQQLPDRSYFRELSFVWNPAMTAGGDYWEGFGAYRRQWIGFNGSPRTASLGIQYPFLDYNMSLGGFIMHDHVAPMKVTTIGGSYAYHFKVGLTSNDRLSLGIMGKGSQFLVDAQDIEVNDLDDALLPSGEQSEFILNAGMGIYYVSNAGTDGQIGAQNYFFVGAASNQIFPSELIFLESGSKGNYQRVIHANAVAGAHIANNNLAIEPYAWLNYAGENIIDVNMGIILEQENAFWAGAAYGTNKTMTIQAGYIVADGVLLDDNYIRIGSLANLNVGTIGETRGMSFEFYIAYRVKI